MKPPTTQSVPYEDWYIPTVEEIEDVREQEEMSKKELGDILGYSHANNYNSTISKTLISMGKVRKAADYFREQGAVDWYAPTVGEINEELKRRDISQTHFSIALGYNSKNSFNLAVSRGSMRTEKYFKVTDVLDFHEENGYLPMPYELE